MNRRKLKKVYTQIAAEHGVSVEEVAREIEIALKLARNNPDPKVQAHWAAISCKGEAPSAMDVIAHLANEVKCKADA